MRIIGAAEEFWRVRLTRMDTAEGLDFEWHEDILYRKPSLTPAEEVESYNVEAVSLADSDHVVRIATFYQRDAAQDYLDRASTDLHEMTKNQFEEAYLASTGDDAKVSSPE